MNSYQSANRPEAQQVSYAGRREIASPYEPTFVDHRFLTGEAGKQSEFDPLKLLLYVIHYRWLIGVFLITGIFAGLMYSFMQTPLYRATAEMEIQTTGAKVLQDLEAVTQLDGIRDFETVRLKLHNRSLARRVVYELDLANDEKFQAPAPKFSLFNLVNRATGTRAAADLEGMDASQREAMAVRKVLSGLSAELIRNSSLISVSYSHPSAEHAARVVNQVVRSYIDHDIDKTSEKSDLARQFVQHQVGETKIKLQNSEQALVDYANGQGITLTGDDASLIAENIAKLNSALGQAIHERLVTERYYNQVASGDAAALPEVFQNGTIQTAKAEIVALSATYREKLRVLKPDFPEMQQLQLRISELRAQIEQQIGVIANSINIRYRQASETEEAIKRELAALEKEQQAFQNKYIKYTILKREVDSNRAQYDSLIAKLNEVGVGSQIKSSNASVVELAEVPSAPYSPLPLINVLASLAIAGAIAAALIYLLEVINNSFTVPDQVESELGLPVLGIIPVANDSEFLEIADEKHSNISEAYRTLRTSLRFTGTENNMRTLLVTSSEPAEGKSTTVYKLAAEFAALGRRVLVIDADLRKPQMHRLFKTGNTIGLSNLLSNLVRSGETAEIFHKTSFPNITLLPAGIIPPNPVDLLSSQRMGLVLHYGVKKFDLVIIDSPPIMGLSDAPILARLADASLLVVTANRVSRKAAKVALSRLAAAGANVVGAALTRFSIDKYNYNYAYRYMQFDYYNYNGNQIEDNAAPPRKNPAFRPKLVALFSAVLGRFNRRSA